jgi:hypothetical protein
LPIRDPQFHATIAGDQDILRFDIPVDDTLFLEVLQPARNLDGHANAILKGSLTTGVDDLAESLALNVLYDQEVEFPGAPEVIESNQVRTGQPSHRRTFARKAFRKRRIRGEV